MKDLNKEFESFVNDASEPGSEATLRRVQQQIQAEQPRLQTLAVKIGLAHLLGSFVTLMACSQFGVQLFFEGGGLMNVFMKVSPRFCEGFCAALYFSISLLTVRATLKPEEWIRLQKSRSLAIGSLALMSLGALALVSHQVNFQTGLIWLLGATMGGELASLIPRRWLQPLLRA